MNDDDIDHLTRTVIGEAGDQPDSGKAAVSHVILNRLNSGKYGSSVGSVIFAPNQFEPWNNTATTKKLMAISPDSKQYKDTRNIVQGTLDGEIPDPTGGATHFLQPDIVMKRSGKLPSWAKNPTAQIGDHSFYDPDNINTVQRQAANNDNLLGSILHGQSSTPTTPVAAQDLPSWAIPPSQQTGQEPETPDLLHQFVPAPAKPTQLPPVQTFEGAPSRPPTATPEDLQNPEAIAPSDIAQMGRGAWQGAKDVVNTLAQGGMAAQRGLNRGMVKLGIVTPEDEAAYEADAAARNARIAQENQAFDQSGTNMGTLGRIAGQIVASAPAFAAGEAALAVGGNAALRAGSAIPGVRSLISGVSDARAAVAAERAATPFAPAPSAGPGAKLINATTNVARDVTRGAAIGSEANALTASTSDEPVGEQIAGGAKLGAVVGPGTRVLKGIGKRVGRFVHDIVEPLSDKGQTQIADRAINEIAAGGLTGVSPSTVPGVTPTLAEAITGGNAGVSTMQRHLRDIAPNEFIPTEQSNASAREGAFRNISGDASTIADLEKQRDTTALPLLKQAFTNKTDTDPSSVVRYIDRQLAGPDGKRPEIAKALNEVKDNLTVENPLNERVSRAIDPINTAIKTGGMSAERTAAFTEARRLLNSARRGFTSEDDLTKQLNALAKKEKIVGPIDNALDVIKEGPTKLESDPEMLYGVRKAIGDSLSPLAKGTEKDRQAASAHLKEVMTRLDDSIEKGAPGFKNWLSTYAAASRPIDVQKTLQNLNVTDTNGNVTLGKLDNALKGIEKARLKPGIRPEKSIPVSTLADLYSIKNDLQKAGQITLGKSIGSNTVQNLGSSQALGKIGRAASVFTSNHPALGPILTMGVGNVYSEADKRILGKIIERFTDAPQGAAALNSFRNSRTRNLLMSRTGMSLPGTAASVRTLSSSSGE